MLLNQRHLKLSVWLDWMNQWAELLDAGMPTVDALSLSTALLGQAHAEQRLKISLQQTQLALETGKPLAQAFEGASLTPPDCLRLALLCGASTGDLSKALRQQIAQAQYLASAQNTLFKSLIYPGMVLIMSLVSWWLLQQFTQSNGAPPPSRTTPSDYLLGLGFISTLALWLLHRRQRPAFAQAQGALGQRMGWLLPSGPQKVSGLFFVMACQVEAGIDLIQVLKHASTPAPKTHRKRRKSPLDRELTRFTYTLLQSLAHGQPLHAAMHSARAPAFMVTQARIAEQTGRLDTCFYLAAKVFDLQAKKRQAQLQAWLGPVTLLLAAGILIYAYQTTLAPLYANLGGF